MDNKVEKRTVSRWFVNGKGYANETLAYLALAKKALIDKLLPRALRNLSDECGTGECIKAEFIKEFPPQDPCPFLVNYGFGRPYCQCAEGRKAFCNKARWKWLRDKAKELKERDAQTE